jgi:hypothetical protein
MSLTSFYFSFQIVLRRYTFFLNTNTNIAKKLHLFFFFIDYLFINLHSEALPYSPDRHCPTIVINGQCLVINEGMRTTNNVGNANPYNELQRAESPTINSVGQSPTEMKTDAYNLQALKGRNQSLTENAIIKPLRSLRNHCALCG